MKTFPGWVAVDSVLAAGNLAAFLALGHLWSLAAGGLCGVFGLVAWLGR